MKQVLTQQEIDALLSAMSNGEIDEETLLSEEKEMGQVKAYDFRRPTKLSKEYINTLFMIFEDFSKFAGNHLSTQIRTNVSLKLASIEQISYDEFIHSIPKFTLLGLFHSTPLNGIQMIEINPQLCMLIVELLCGGNEAQILKNEDVEKKSFTDIEIAILEEIFKTFVSAFENAWKEITDIESKLDSLDTNPQLLQNMSPNEPVVLVTFTATIFKRNTFINLCIPYVFFEGIIDKLSFRNWFDSDKNFNKIDNEHLQKNIESVELELETVLGQTVMTLSDFAQLEVGDTISLDQKISEPLKMYIENQQFGLVKPGKKEDKFAVELLEFSEGNLNDE
ncbi:flagellar motor switch protein FliM [Vagococcus fluvialis]|uniref:Flagellar motor switch protein FliM n=1 Tax=Vagococcus fluvialis TaxID=2738 RepID=A0A369AVN0_9ENTE|nr:flagellar motor switch protein FliM [Vagococcus fluvialis]MBO0443372.1 flagellar motor switch protein FliM [Vagococcus fluvialis]MCM2137803.1 flagellar motor switch protein FliM [Vagococcus fluvialis]MDT2747897.1 flagellar motor switch protein FliM [Vagococcus fluvialis]NKC68311.1 flagellar motor switch protein FliM [Vagococcus fluvialis]RCX12286.1 flagellar motor switch protein FliM [Vagococcus fluvialis]